MEFAHRVVDRWCQRASTPTGGASENSPYLPNDRLDPRTPKRLRPRRPSPSEFLTASRPSSSHWTDSPEVFARARRYLAVSPGSLQATRRSALPGRGTHAEPDPSFPSEPSPHGDHGPLSRPLAPLQSSTTVQGVCSWLHVAPRQAARRRRSFQHEPRLVPSPSGTLAVTSVHPLHLLRSLPPSANPFAPPRRTGLEVDALLEFCPLQRSTLGLGFLEPIPAVTDRVRSAPRALSTPPSPQASRTTPPAPS